LKKKKSKTPHIILHTPLPFRGLLMVK